MKPTTDPCLDKDGLYDARRDPFERRLERAPDSKRGGIVAVADTAYIALGWLQANGLEFTAADVLRMTEMMLAAMKEEDDVTRAALAPHGRGRG